MKSNLPKKQKPKGVRVTLEDGNILNFQNAIGWNWDSNGILNVASPERLEQVGANGQTVMVNDLYGSFRKWAHVGWL